MVTMELIKGCVWEKSVYIFWQPGGGVLFDTLSFILFDSTKAIQNVFGGSRPPPFCVHTLQAWASAQISQCLLFICLAEVTGQERDT